MCEKNGLGLGPYRLPEFGYIYVIRTDIDIYEDRNHPILDDRVDCGREARSHGYDLVPGLEPSLSEQGTMSDVKATRLAEEPELTRKEYSAPVKSLKADSNSSE